MTDTSTHPSAHRWPEDDGPPQGLGKKLSRYQRAVRWLQGTLILGGIGRGLAYPAGSQDPISNVIGIGVNKELSVEPESPDASTD